MDTKELKSSIEVLANFCEEEGFIKEAYRLDLVLNSIDSITSKKVASNIQVKTPPNFTGTWLLKSQLERIYNEVAFTLNKIIEAMNYVDGFDDSKLERTNKRFKEFIAKPGGGKFSIRNLVKNIIENSGGIKADISRLVSLVDD